MSRTSEQDSGSGDRSTGLKAKIQAELAFFEGATQQARAWRKEWRVSAPEERPNLVSKQSELIEEILRRDESLAQIHRLWREQEGSLGRADRDQIQDAVRHLDHAMRALIQIEKRNLEITDQSRRALIQEISDLRTAREAHMAYLLPSGSPPHCVDRKL